MAQDVGRSFSLRQIREIDRVRYLAPEIEIDAITFATGSAAIDPGQAQQLAALGRTLVSLIEENPAEVFLIEGHTDAVGDASYNLALSDRRAESVALALTEYFDVPPENLVVQGYGESDLKVPTQAAERENRRANVRRITGLLGTQQAELR
jgi:outer membrane protein OmpA-like peptidoglycan-associated protein